MTESILFAQAQGAPAWSMLIWLLILPLMYFMLIRPQQKAQKEAQEFRGKLKANDAVITAGGIYGKIVQVEDQTVTLEIAPKTRIKVLRSQIVAAQPVAKPAIQSVAKEATKETGEEKRGSDAS